MKTWIVVASRTEAKIFEYSNKKNSTVTFLMKLDNPRGRLRPIEINADKPGMFGGLTTYGTRLVKAQSPTERIAQDFAKKVAVFLNEASQERKFDELIVVSNPHFIGRLRGLFTKELKLKISREIIKDLGPVTTRELKERLWPQEEANF